MPICPRFHFFEICDEKWFPASLRAIVQADLTLLWTFRVPIIQRTTPAELVASVLIRVLGVRASEYTYVDFCSGAGGPTPAIEREINRQFHDRAYSDNESTSVTATPFLLTDLHPHVEAWKSLSKKSPNLRYIPTPVDATRPPKNILEEYIGTARSRKQLYLFSLAFHHFPDPLAIAVLENALETSDGFAILELAARDLPTLILTALLWPLLLVITPFYFATDPFHLFWTYILPTVPFVILFDGVVSALRTRTPAEVNTLLRNAAATVAVRQREAAGNTGNANTKNAGHCDEVGGHLLLRDWTFMSGSEMHTPPLGKLSWIVCIKNGTTGDRPAPRGRLKNGVQRNGALDLAALRQQVRDAIGRRYESISTNGLYGRSSHT